MTNEPPTEKTCNVCRKTREIAFFSIKQESRDGHNGACKLCLRKGGLGFARRAKRAENGTKTRQSGMRQPLKLTDDVAGMVYNRYLAGEKLQPMADETGISYNTYRARFKRLGFPFPVKKK